MQNYRSILFEMLHQRTYENYMYEQWEQKTCMITNSQRRCIPQQDDHSKGCREQDGEDERTCVARQRHVADTSGLSTSHIQHEQSILAANCHVTLTAFDSMNAILCRNLDQAPWLMCLHDPQPAIILGEPILTINICRGQNVAIHARPFVPYLFPAPVDMVVH